MSVVRDFFRLGPARDDHYPALRCAIGVAVPLLALLSVNRPDLAIYAVFGAFTGVFGRSETYRRRLIHQSQAAVLLVLSVLIGVLNALAGSPGWLVIGSTALVAALGSLAAQRFRLGPVGPFFFIFAAAATSYVPVHDAPGILLLLSAAAAALSILIGVSGLFVRRILGRPARLAGPAQAPLGNWPGMMHGALRYIVAIGAAGVLSILSGVGHSHWAMLSAAVPLMGPDVARRVVRGLHRILGTLVGLMVLALLLRLELAPWGLVLAVVVLQFLTELFVVRHYGLAMVFITPLALLMTELGAPTDPGRLVLDRVIETAIGVCVGIAVALLMRDRPARQPVTGAAG
jgi:Fusaric acid resistance protein-like